MPLDDSGFPLPLIINPPRICIQIEIPNERYHIAAFLGNFVNLGYWFNWQRDARHTGLAVSQVWYGIFLQAADAIFSGGNCCVRVPGCGGVDTELMIRQNPTNPCILESSLDGVNWCEWADLSKCLPPPVQPGGGTIQPKPGGCASYHASMPANDKWILPTIVNAGDTIETKNLDGAGNDGLVADGWNCPTGTIFFAGACVAGTGGTNPSDPLPTALHMKLIAQIAGVFYDATTMITVPVGVSNAQVIFQVNDTTLGDNFGNYNFDVDVCNNGSISWSHTLDFTTSPHAYTVDPEFSCTSGDFGAWSAGSGWIQGYCLNSITNYEQISIELLFSALIAIDSVIYTYDAAVDPLNAGTNTSDSITYRDSASTQHISTSLTQGSGTNLTLSDLTPKSVRAIGIRIEIGSVDTPTSPTGTATIKRLIVTGHGADPFI